MYIKRLSILPCFLLSFCFFNPVVIAAAKSNQSLPLLIKQQLLSGQFNLAAEELNKLAIKGNPEAEYQLAILYLNGRGVKKSSLKAEQLLISSAISSADSALLLGSLYQKGKQLKANPTKAIHYLKIATSLGNRKAAKLLTQLKKNKQDKIQVSPELQKSLMLAIRKKNLKQLIAIFEKGANLNHASENRFTPLILSVKENNIDITNWLLRQQVNVLQKDHRGNTALHHAAASTNLKILIILADKVSNLEPLNHNRQTPLIYGAMKGFKETSQWLLSKKSNPKLKDKFGKTTQNYSDNLKLALLYDMKFKTDKQEKQRLVLQQNKHQLKTLTAQTLDPKNVYYQWPILHLALSQKNIILSKILISDNDPWQLNPLGDTAFAIALATGQTTLLQEMFKRHPISKSRNKKSIESLFQLAISRNDLNLVKTSHTFIDEKSIFADYDYSIKEAIKSNSLDVTKYLINKSSQKPTGEMLHLAINANYIEITAALLIENAPVNWQDKQGHNALWLAVDNGLYDLVNLFILYKVDIDSVDIKGQTALMRAAINDDIKCATILIEHQADPEISALSGNTSVMFAAQKSNSVLELLLMQNIDLSKRNNLTYTSLMLAIKSANLNTVRTLLEAGANPKKRNNLGQDSYDLASEYPEIISLLNDY